MIYCVACGRQPPSGSRFCPFCGSKLPQTGLVLKDPLIGKEIDGKYKIIAKVGSGAMGSIYRAEHTTLQRSICLKVLHKHLIKDESYIKRFHREARAASRLDHPNCVKIYDYGHTEDELTYIAMEFIEGRDLAQVLYTDYPLSMKGIFHITTQICDALDEAHFNNIVHRDMKPENIMITKRRDDPFFVKVLDFGIARIQDASPTSIGGFKTATGMVFGTPEYMSPEQIRGEELDSRTDIYSFGIVLYQVLTGQLPFTGDTIIEIATKHISMKPPPLKQFNNKIPDEAEKIVLKMLKKKREERFQTVREIKEKFNQVKNKIFADEEKEKEEREFFVTTEKMELKEKPQLISSHNTEEEKPTIAIKGIEVSESSKIKTDEVFPREGNIFQYLKTSKTFLIGSFLLGFIIVLVLIYYFFG